jgi:hypothetical protein
MKEMMILMRPGSREARFIQKFCSCSGRITGNNPASLSAAKNA